VIDKTLASKIASPYAEALLDFAKRGKSFDEMNQDINVISQFVSSSKDLERFLANPVVTNESKKTVLKDLLGEQVSAPTLKFLMLLVEKDRIEYLGPITDAYTALAAKESSSEVAEVTSVTHLSSAQQEKLKSNLKKLRGTSNIELVLKVDPTLLGGFVVQIGSSVLDFSLAGALNKMQNHFQSVTL
jgi:F-type H+-transporting ATPase subunit delta